MVGFAQWPVEWGRFAPNWPLAAAAAISSAWSWLDAFATFLAAGAAVTAGGLLFYVTRERPGVALGRIGWLACLCLAISGAAHLFDLFGDWEPLRGLSGSVKMLLAATAWGAVWAMWPEIQRLLSTDEAPDPGLPAGTRELQDLTTRLQNEASARRRVEQSLRESEERLRMVVRAGRMGTWDWDLATGATRLDRQERELFGLPEGNGSVHVTDVFARMHPADREGVRDACQTSIDDRVGYDHEFRVVAPDGSTRWLAGRGDVIRNAAGAALRMVGVNFDVTERRSKEQHYRLIDRALQAATNGITVADAQSEEVPIIYVNAGFEEMTGYKADEVVGRNCRFLQGPETDPDTVETIRKALAAGSECHVTILNYRKDSSKFWNELRITPVFDEAGHLTHFVGVQADVTERKRFEESLRRAEARAQAASQAKSEFLANMSHEIRTPLTAVLGCADTLFPRLTIQEQREMVQMIRSQGRLLLGILNDVLDLSKIEAGRLEIHREPSSIVGIIEDVRSLLEPQATEKGLDVRAEYASEMPVEIRTDPLRMRQVLVNLVGNAIKFTERGEVAVIGFCDVESDPPQIIINVKDTGIGIAKDKLEAIFDAFSQENSELSRKFGGTGLGLTISQRLLKMLGGQIQVASRVGDGTTFTITLPIAEAETRRMESGGVLMQESIDQQRSRDSINVVLPIRVLLAEDTRGLQFMIRRMLEDAGAAVAVVDNGERAVEEVVRAERTGQPYDIVLMDMQMPIMDGFEATAELRREGCHVPIVALTAAAMHGDRERCLAAGCDDYLSKPIDRHTLLDVLARRYNRMVASR